MGYVSNLRIFSTNVVIIIFHSKSRAIIHVTILLNICILFKTREFVGKKKIPTYVIITTAILKTRIAM